MRNNDLAHERNLARDSGEQAIVDTKQALRRSGALVVVVRQHETQRTVKVTYVNLVNVQQLVRLRNRPSRANRGDIPSQWEYRFIVGAPGSRIETFTVTPSGFDYDKIAEHLLWVVEDQARKKTEREELRALRSETKPTSA